MMADKGVWLSIHLSSGRRHCSAQAAKADKSAPGHCWNKHSLPIAKAHNSRLPSARYSVSPQKSHPSGIMLTHLTRWYESAEILKMATGPMANCSRCPDRAIPIRGSSESLKRALADLIVVDGDPIANIALVENRRRIPHHHEGRKSTRTPSIRDVTRRLVSFNRIMRPRAAAPSDLLVAGRNLADMSRKSCPREAGCGNEFARHLAHVTA